MVSKNLHDADRRKYEYDPEVMLRTSMPAEVDQAVPDPLLFVVLKSGESYSTEHEVHILVRDGSEFSRHFLPPHGHHVLKLGVATWDRGTSLAQALSERWRKLGSLWTDDLESSPMEFTIEPLYEQHVGCDPK